MAEIFHTQHKKKGSKFTLAALLSAAVLWGSAVPSQAEIVNSVEVSGNFGTATVKASATEKVDVIDQIATLSLEKIANFNDANGNGVADAGETITYTFTASNTGNVTVKNVVLTDDKVSASNFALSTDFGKQEDSTDGAANGWDILAPGDILTSTATYTILASDLDVGEVKNTARIDATTLPGNPVFATGSATTPFSTASSMTLEKTGTLDLAGKTAAEVGDEITYQFKVTNTGPTKLRNVSISDPLIVAEAAPSATGLQNLIQVASLPADPITTASLPALESYGNAAREPATWTSAVPDLHTALFAERRLVRLTAADDIFKVGDKVGVYYKLTNTGDVPLTNITVLQPGDAAFASQLDVLAPNTTDASSILFTHVLSAEDIDSGQIDVTSGIIAHGRNRALTGTLKGPLSLLDVDAGDDIATASIMPTVISELTPGASTIFNATYKITQDDIDAGEVLNTAQASATTAMNTPILVVDSVTVKVPQLDSIAVEKTAALDLGQDNKASIDDVITYTFVLTNTGNTTLDDVQLVDLMPGVALNFTEFDGLKPGEEKIFTGTYKLKQADIDAGKVENQATASGKPSRRTGRVSGASDDPSTTTPNDKTTLKIPAAPSMTLVKYEPTLGDDNGNGFADAGEKLTWTFKVHNTGNVKLSNVTLTDRVAGAVVNPSAPTNVSMEAGAIDTTTFKATYVLTVDDINKGTFQNTADVVGQGPEGTTAKDTSHPNDENADGATEFSFTPNPALAVLKPQPKIDDKNNNGITDLGDVLTYDIIVRNTGNVTLANVVVKDLKDNNFVSTIASLLPGEANQQIVKFIYTVSSEDMKAGQIENIAVAEANYKGEAVSDKSDLDNVAEDDPTITAIVARPAIALVKPQPDINDKNNNGTTDVGDELTYKLIVTNTGNVELTNFAFNDVLGFVDTTKRTTPLAAGETDSTSFKLVYALTANDILTGKVTNTAEVLALAPKAVVTKDTSDFENTTGDRATETNLATLLDPKIALLKNAQVVDSNNNGITDVGDRINYTFSVTNTGNVVLTDVEVVDAKLAPEFAPNPALSEAGKIASLGVNVTKTFSSFHIITQNDVNAGAYENSAVVNAKYRTRILSDVSDPLKLNGDSATVVTMTQTRAISVIKPQPKNKDNNGNGRIDIDDELTYSFEVRNLGNVTLYNVTLTDEFAQLLPNTQPLARLEPGEVITDHFKARRIVTEEDAKNGKITNIARVQAAVSSGGTLSVEDYSHETSATGREPTVTLITIVPPVLTKTAARSTIRRGERVEYTIAATELGRGPYDIADIMPPGFSFVEGSASINGAAVTPARSGKALTFANITPDLRRRITLKLSLVASASNSTGDFINRARIYANVSGQLLAEAQARVTIKEEHVFDCGEIIGRVFDDVNNNGYMDDGEVGLPGVRVVTVKGLLVTTDKMGRFHVTCADVPNGQIGSNFLMKLDPRTLPAGYTLTSENPRDVRLTRGKITKINFGASKRRDVGLDLTKDAFGQGLDLKPKFATGLDRLVSLLQQGKGQLTLTYRCGVYAPIADERLDAVEDLLQAKWKQEGGNKPLKITKRVECGK